MTSWGPLDGNCRQGCSCTVNLPLIVSCCTSLISCFVGEKKKRKNNKVTYNWSFLSRLKLQAVNKKNMFARIWYCVFICILLSMYMYSTVFPSIADRVLNVKTDFNIFVDLVECSEWICYLTDHTQLAVTFGSFLSFIERENVDILFPHLLDTRFSCTVVVILVYALTKFT